MGRSLGWGVEAGERVGRRRVWRAPSWSWAAGRFDSPVVGPSVPYSAPFDDQREGLAVYTYTTVNNAQVEAVGESVYGELGGGRLVVGCERLL